MKNRRFLSLLLAVIMMLSAAVIPINAESGTDTEPDSSSGITWEDVLAGVADPYDYYGPIDPSTVPEAVGIDVANERQHVERLYEEEGTSLYNAKFKNADGTITEYLFDYPIKYVDENGDIKDITLEIESDAIEEGVYVTADNSIETTMSRSIFDGIGLNYSDLSVTLIPILETTSSSVARTASAQEETSITSTAELIDNRTVSYYYDDKTTIEYSLTYAGFKEDIVVSEYTGQTEYEFTLLTEGLTLTEIDGSYYLTDDGDIKATLGDIIIFTADERNNTTGWMSHETVVANQEYIITIHVDADYLRDENTAYPIRIDPTIEVNADSGSGSGAIEDVTINSASASSGSSGALYIGKRETYGISRVLMRFPALDLTDVSSADVVNSATVEIRDILCESETMVVYCSAFTGNTWTESTADWSTVNPDSMGASVAYNPVSYSLGVNLTSPHRYSFNITSIVKGWIAGNYSQSKGIIFHSSSVETGSTYIHKTFASYNRTTNKPSLTINYDDPDLTAITDGTYYLNNKNYGAYLNKSSSTAVNAQSGLLSSLGTSVQWQIRAVDGGYIIRSASDTTKYLGVATSGKTVQLVTVSESTIPTRCLWQITTATGGGCLIKSKYNSYYLCENSSTVLTISSTGTAGSEDYYKRVWRLATTSYYGNSSSNTKREMSSNTTISNIEAELERENITPVVNSYYSNELWVSATDFDYSFDTSGIVTDSLGKLTIGKTLGGAIVTATHKVTNRQIKFYVLAGFSSSVSSTILPEHFEAGLNQPYDVWPAGEESRYYSYTTSSRTQALTDIMEAAWVTIAGGWAIDNPNASSMLSHYLDNTGLLYETELKSLMVDAPTAYNNRTTHMNGLISAVEASATTTNKTIRTIYAIGCDVEEGTDFGRSIGSYCISITCQYKKNSDGTYTANIIYELHDVYDWDPEDEDMGIIPVSPRDMWELHHGGVAKNYEVYGCNTFTMTWTEGQTFELGVVLSNET